MEFVALNVVGLGIGALMLGLSTPNLCGSRNEDL
jgi:hypothetical protein